MNNLYSIIEKQGYKTAKAFSEHSGVSESTLSDIINNRTKPNKKSREKIAHALNMSVEEVFPNTTKQEPKTMLKNTFLTQDTYQIKHYKQKVSAGTGVVDNNEKYSYIAIQKEQLQKIEFTNINKIKNLVAFEITGNSMEPLAKDKSIMIVDTEALELNKNDYYMFWYDGLFVKQFTGVNDKFQYIFSSLNKEYKDIIIKNPNQYKLYGKAIGLLPNPNIVKI